MWVILLISYFDVYILLFCILCYYYYGRYIVKKLKLLIVALLVLLVVPFAVFAEDENNDSIEDNKVNVYFFRGEGCSHCAEAEEFFDSIEKEYGQYFNLVDYETWYNSDNASLLEKVAEARGEDVQGVPYIIIGDKSWSGYSSDFDDDIKSAIKSVYDTSSDQRYDIMQLVDTGTTNSGSSSSSETSSSDAVILVAIIVIVGAVVSGVVMARKNTI